MPQNATLLVKGARRMQRGRPAGVRVSRRFHPLVGGPRSCCPDQSSYLQSEGYFRQQMGKTLSRVDARRAQSRRRGVLDTANEEASPWVEDQMQHICALS